MFNDQLSIHNKAKNKKNKQTKTVTSQISRLKIHFLKLLVSKLFEHMIKATNPLPRIISLVHLRCEEWRNLEPKWGPGMHMCGGVGEVLGEEVR